MDNLSKVNKFFQDSCNRIIRQKKPGFKNNNANYIGESCCQLGIMLKDIKQISSNKFIKNNISFGLLHAKKKKAISNSLLGFSSEKTIKFLDDLQVSHDASVLVYVEEGYGKWLSYYKNKMNECAKNWGLNPIKDV